MILPLIFTIASRLRKRGAPGPTPERAALIRKMTEAKRRRHTQGVGKARKAIKAAVAAELRQYVGRMK